MRLAIGAAGMSDFAQTWLAPRAYRVSVNSGWEGQKRAIKRPSDHAAQAAGSSPRTYSNPQSHDYARSPALHPRPALTSTSGGFPPGSVTIPQAAADKCRDKAAPRPQDRQP